MLKACYSLLQLLSRHVNQKERDMEMPEIVSHDVWVAARRKLLVEEKEWSLKRDALSAERRKLPMEEIMKKYIFQGSEGRRTLADLFEGKRQLLVYHFMFWPDDSEGGPL